MMDPTLELFCAHTEDDQQNICKQLWEWQTAVKSKSKHLPVFFMWFSSLLLATAVL